MAWDYDQPPLEYLRRRFLYYKRKWGHLSNLDMSESLWMRYGKSLPEIIERRLIQIEEKMEEFERAIKILETHGKDKKKRK